MDTETKMRIFVLLAVLGGAVLIGLVLSWFEFTGFFHDYLIDYPRQIKSNERYIAALERSARRQREVIMENHRTIAHLKATVKIQDNILIDRANLLRQWQPTFPMKAIGKDIDDAA